MRPVCVKCSIEFKMKRSVDVGQLFRGGKLYQIWRADLWECPICGYQITVGYGQNPRWIHHFDTEERPEDCDVIAYDTVGEAECALDVKKAGQRGKLIAELQDLLEEEKKYCYQNEFGNYTNDFKLEKVRERIREKEMELRHF